MIVKKASPGLDQGDTLKDMLPPGITIEEFDDSRSLSEQVAEAEIFLTRSVPVTREVIDAAPKLKLIQRFGVHVEAVDMQYAAERGIPVCNIPAEFTSGGRYVAEHALFLMLAVAKRYEESKKSIQNQIVGLPLTHGLYNKTLGLIGVGGTGKHLIPMAKGLGMRVIAVKQTVSAELQDQLQLDWLGTEDKLEELLAQSDIVSVHLPMSQETRDYIGSKEFESMKDNAILINIARGPIVDYFALSNALSSGKLIGAGLDVLWEEPIAPDDPLLSMENVVVTPHIAGFTKESRKLTASVVRDNVLRVRDGQEPLHILNL